MDAAERAEAGWNAFFLAHLGPTGATLAWTAILLLGVVLLAVFRRYVALLGCGGAAEGSDERRDYDGLRSSLAEGGWAAQVDGRMLSGFVAASTVFSTTPTRRI